MKLCNSRTAAMSMLPRNTMLHNAGMFYDGGETIKPCHTLRDLFTLSTRPGERTYIARVQFGIEHATDFILEPVVVPWDDIGTPLFISGVVYDRLAKFEREDGGEFTHLLLNRVNLAGTAIEAYWQKDGFCHESYVLYRKEARAAYNAVIEAVADGEPLLSVIQAVDQGHLSGLLNQHSWQLRSSVLAEQDDPDNENWNRRWKSYHIATSACVGSNSKHQHAQS